jgi:hypothetical protein
MSSFLGLAWRYSEFQVMLVVSRMLTYCAQWMVRYRVHVETARNAKHSESASKVEYASINPMLQIYACPQPGSLPKHDAFHSLI